MRRRTFLLGMTAAAATASGAPADEGIGPIGPDDLAFDAASGLYDVRFGPLVGASRRRLAGAAREKGAAWARLARLVARGEAAGLAGTLYDNRDRGHSTLRPERHPHLTFVAYDPALQARGLDYGLNDRLRFDAATFGNSSTAIKNVRVGRSLPRSAMTTPAAMNRVAELYAANHLYVYPEHRDHDSGRGDLFPANTAQMVVSQGSSGSDKPFVRALAAIYAALRPETKARLVERGLMAPTTQMILRRGMRGVVDDAVYLSARAHPSAFDGAAVDLERIVDLAQALTPDAIPPAVRLRATPTRDPIPGIEIFGDGLGERLFETPDAAAIVAHGAFGARRFRLSVEETVDPSGRPLRFHWRVLRGPGSEVRPLDAAGREAEAVIRWTAPYPAPDDAGLKTFRADVAVFADNGRALSAPAFFSVAFPPDQRRVHHADGRPVWIDHRTPPEDDRYVDPVIFPRRDWRDDFDYDAEGALAGWRRTYADGSTARFTRHGFKVARTDEAGRPILAQPVRYPLRAERRGRPRFVEVEAGAPARYVYDGPSDHRGAIEASLLPGFR